MFGVKAHGPLTASHSAKRCTPAIIREPDEASRCRFAADASVSVSWRWLKITDYPRSTPRPNSWKLEAFSRTAQAFRSLPARRPLRGQNSQRSETGRVAGRAAQQVGACSLRHDAFQLHLAGVLKYGLAVIEFQMTTFRTPSSRAHDNDRAVLVLDLDHSSPNLNRARKLAPRGAGFPKCPFGNLPDWYRMSACSRGCHVLLNPRQGTRQTTSQHKLLGRFRADPGSS
jgi:hypothetical protein